MAWVRLDDHFPEHPKFLGLGKYLPLCGWLQICALSYCNRHLTDGRFPKSAIYAFVPHLETLRFDTFKDPHDGTTTDAIYASQLADIMVTNRIWIDEGDFFRIHDFLNYQPSKEQVTKDRASNKIRQDRYRNGHRNGVTNGETTPAPDPDPDPDPISNLKDLAFLEVRGSTTSKHGAKAPPLSQAEKDKHTRLGMAAAMRRPHDVSRKGRRG